MISTLHVGGSVRRVPTQRPRTRRGTYANCTFLLTAYMDLTYTATVRRLSKIKFALALAVGLLFTWGSLSALQPTCKLDCHTREIHKQDSAHHSCHASQQKVVPAEKLSSRCENCHQIQNAQTQFAELDRSVVLDLESIAVTSAVDFSPMPSQSKLLIRSFSSFVRPSITITLQRLLI